MSFVRKCSKQKVRKIITACLLSTGLAFASKDEVAELDLSMLFNLKVTTASKRAEKVEDSPGVIATVTSYEIEKMGAKNLIDVLNRVPSLQMYNSSMFGVNKASIRGDAFNYLDNHTLILIDGRPCREGVRQGFDSPVYTMFPVDVIDRIEVVRGPGSVLYGSTAMSGVINIITKNPGEENSFTVGASNERDVYQSAVLSAADAEKRKGVLVANQLHLNQGYTYKTEWFDFAQGGVVPFEKELQTAEVGVFSHMKLNDLSVKAFFGRTEYSSLGWMEPIASAANNMQSRLFVNIDKTTKLSDNWEIISSGTWNLTDVELYAEADFPDGDEDTVGFENASDFLVESYVNGSIGDNFNLLWGGLVLNENKWNIEQPTRVPDRYHNLFYSTYGQIDYTIKEKVKLLAGFQLNKPRGEDIDVVPRFGIISNIYKGFGTKVLYGEAYRSPIMPEKAFVSQPDPAIENFLSPEKIKTLDAQLFYAGEKGNAAATFFRSKMSNFISLEQDQSKPGFYNNDDEVVATGVEVEGKFSPVDGLVLNGSWMNQVNKKTYNKNVYDQMGMIIGTEKVTDSKVANAPQWMLKLGTTYTTPFDLSTGFWMETYGKASMYENNSLETTPSPDKSVMLSANIGYTLPFEKKFHLNLTMKNIRNDKAHQPFLLGGSIPTDYISREKGRTLEATITTSF